jgi:DNA-3-methyladenine glycosylase II
LAKAPSRRVRGGSAASGAKAFAPPLRATPEDIRKGTRLVARKDPKMAALIKRVGPFSFRAPGDDSFAALVRSIMYQQLAGAAATAIHGRFLKLFPDGLTPAGVLALPDGAMRSAGLSGAKQAAVTDLARKITDGTVPLEDVASLSDDDLKARLVQVRGIGPWTAEMFMMFQLQRLDIWPVEDYGVRKGWTVIHRKRELIAPKALLAEGEKFRPYRTIAAWYCWRAVEAVLPTS